VKYRKITDVRCAYPFLYDEDSRSDFEVLSDQITVEIALVIAHVKEEEIFSEILRDLEILREKTMDLNGSIRGRIGISDLDLTYAIRRYDHYKAMTRDLIGGFILPSGSLAALGAHRVRGMFKALVRVMKRVEDEGFEVPERLFDYANVLSNLFFVMASGINYLEGHQPIPYESKNY
jgi:cob(I)alamin adenosyltransferase